LQEERFSGGDESGPHTHLRVPDERARQRGRSRDAARAWLRNGGRRIAAAAVRETNGARSASFVYQRSRLAPEVVVTEMASLDRATWSAEGMARRVISRTSAKETVELTVPVDGEAEHVFFRLDWELDLRNDDN